MYWGFYEYNYNNTHSKSVNKANKNVSSFLVILTNTITNPNTITFHSQIKLQTLLFQSSPFQPGVLHTYEEPQDDQ